MINCRLLLPAPAAVLFPELIEGQGDTSLLIPLAPASRPVLATPIPPATSKQSAPVFHRRPSAYKWLVLVVMSCFARVVRAQDFPSDLGDGQFRNPVINADFPDPDVIRVGDTYYMLTTTMFIFPGVPLLKSKDLVNWAYCKNVIPRMDEGPCYHLDGCNRYGHGQWAGSLRYHDGKFYLLFNTLNEGAFLCTATDPEGDWTIKKLGRGFHDCGLFFDDNGKIYVAFGYNDLYITELNAQFQPVSRDSLVFRGNLRKGLEGTHIYKRHGYYYLYCTYGGGDGFQVALRSNHIHGPFEQHIVLHDTTRTVNFGIHQGALVQTQQGEWWTMLFVDIGPFGRFPSLQPVTWVDDWPVAGVAGKAVVTYPKPDVGTVYPPQSLPTSDEFNAPSLGPQWGWNHDPDSTHWSLTQRNGYLRLRSARVVPDLPAAINTLTQRMFAHYDQTIPTTATTCLDVRHMKTGDVAGLAVFQDPYAYLAVKQGKRQRFLVMVNNGQAIDSVAMPATRTVYLRASASNATRKAHFEYSWDGHQFRPLGNELLMRFSLKIFTGNKFCLFNYSTRSTGGYVDYDWFRMQ